MKKQEETHNGEEQSLVVNDPEENKKAIEHKVVDAKGEEDSHGQVDDGIYNDDDDSVQTMKRGSRQKIFTKEDDHDTVGCNQVTVNMMASELAVIQAFHWSGIYSALFLKK